MPEALAPLRRLADNLWWSWNPDAVDLFRRIAGDSWEMMQYNPVAVLDELSADKATQLINDSDFMSKMDSICHSFDRYMAEKPAEMPLVGYFCMEYGLHISLKLYSGGLGVLAGII